MRLRLIGKGFQTYTGQMGVIMFENGMSVGDVLQVDAVRVAGVIGAEWEDGSAANVSQRYLDNMTTEASSEPANAENQTQEPETPAENTETVDENGNTENEIEAAHEKAVSSGTFYTEDQLAAVADKDGIAGLREIAAPLGIKGNSIAALIASILKVASAPAPVQTEQVAALTTEQVADITTGQVAALSAAQIAPTAV